MRVLFATTTPPFPPKEGDELVVYEQIRRLSGAAEIHLVTLAQDGLGREAADHHGSLCAGVHALPGGPDPKRAARTLVNGLPMLVNLFLDDGIARRLERIQADVRPDLVHVQSIRMAEYFRHGRGPKVLDLTDADSLNAARRAELESPLRKLAYGFEARLLRRYERQLLRDFPRVLVVSPDDAAHLPAQPERVVVNANGVGLARMDLAAASAPPGRRALVFHGTMSYFPNVDAIVHFARAIFPRLRALFPDLELRVVGRWPAPEVRALHDGRSVVVTGEVDDIVPELRSALVGVYPLRAGTGIQNKVLEALACGLPAVVSPRVAAGFEHLRPGSHYLLARNDDEWVERVARLVEDAGERRRLATAGPDAIFDHYSWDENTRRVLRVWREVLGEAGAAASPASDVSERRRVAGVAR
jgi:sugar transferase (PEP-CTERM/EpsH1 system associated)